MTLHEIIFELNIIRLEKVPFLFQVDLLLTHNIILDDYMKTLISLKAKIF